jgi:hypothetical protein
MTTSLSTSRPIPHGGKFTLTTWFGKMLSEAEDLYGRRDMDWMPIGVEFFDCEKPHIWFPGSREYVCVRLTSMRSMTSTKLCGSLPRRMRTLNTRSAPTNAHYIEIRRAELPTGRFEANVRMRRSKFARRRRGCGKEYKALGDGGKSLELF